MCAELEQYGDDPVAFLDALRKEYPPLMSILNHRQIRLLAKSPKDPYNSKDNNVNEEFLSDMAACYKAKTASREARKVLQEALLAPVKSGKTVEVDKSQAPLSVLKKVGSVAGTSALGDVHTCSAPHEVGHTSMCAAVSKGLEQVL